MYYDIVREYNTMVDFDSLTHQQEMNGRYSRLVVTNGFTCCNRVWRVKDSTLASSKPNLNKENIQVGLFI